MLVRVSAQLAVAGMLLPAASMAAAVFTVIDVFYHRVAASLTTAVRGAIQISLSFWERVGVRVPIVSPA